MTLYNATTQAPVTGILSCDTKGICSTANPFTTDQYGFYSFVAPTGQYYINIAFPGYTYPTKLPTLPANRSIVAGSRVIHFPLVTQFSEIDQPLDANIMLLRITKNANKPEAHVGDIVMYTVNLQNLSAVNAVNNVYLSDNIPPGFKYIKDRVILGGSPISDPVGQRPLLFNVGDIAAGATAVLQYQLVIGSGVTMGTYQNTAFAKYSKGLVISNPAQASVKIVPDPVFD